MPIDQCLPVCFCPHREQRGICASLLTCSAADSRIRSSMLFPLPISRSFSIVAGVSRPTYSSRSLPHGRGGAPFLRTSGLDDGHRLTTDPDLALAGGLLALDV